MKAELSRNIHATQFHIHGDDFHGANASENFATKTLVSDGSYANHRGELQQYSPFLYGCDKIIECIERRSLSPHAQSYHVRHVTRL